jgi:short-subunit dehydrogenase
MELAGCTALVTGASNGIGEQLAWQIADRGAHLVLVARRIDRLTALKKEILRVHPGLTVTVIGADLATADAASAVAGQVGDAGVAVDLLVNNAGVGSHDPFVDEDPGALARQIQLNVGSLVALTAQFLPGMISRDAGGIINVASTAAFQPVPTMAVYGATKAFVLSFTEALWGETRGTGVRVLTLCPGATDTAFFDTTGKKFLTRGRQTPEQVAKVALHALDGAAPTVVSGLSNRLGATGYRLLPRALMVRLSGHQVKETAA